MNRIAARRIGWHVALAATAIAALVFGPDLSASADPTYTVSGTAVDIHGDFPGLATAYLFGDDPSTPLTSDFMDGSSAFTFPGLIAGDYRVEVVADQYEDAWYGGTNYASATAIPVTGSDVDGIGVTLQPITYTVQGTVTGGSPALPLEGQTVELWGAQSGGGAEATTVTDSAGHYEFDGLANDDAASLHFDGGDGWAQEWWLNEYEQSSATTFDDTTNPTLNVTLARLGSVSGRVTQYGHSTLGVAGADVTLQNLAGDTYIADGTTDAQGYYTITNVPSGRYKVNAVGPDAATLGVSSDWSQTWYPNYQRLGYGAVVTVPPDGAATNINIALHRNTRIEGVITDGPTKTPFTVATIELTTPSGDVVQTVGVTDGGKYEFDDLAPGVYKVHVVSNQRTFSDFGSDADDWFGGIDLSAARGIRVASDQTVAGNNVALQPGGMLGGMVAGSPFEPTPFATVELKTVTGVLVQSEVMNDFDWGFQVVPGTYIVEFVSHDGYYSSGYYNASGTFGSATRITVHTGGDITGTTMTFGGVLLGSIHGKVVTSDGSGLPLIVTALRSPTAYLGEAVPLPAVVAPNGSFTITDVPAGKYTIQYGSGEVGPAAYPNRYDQGSVVTVTAGHTVSLATQTVRHEVDITGGISDGGEPAANAQAEIYTLGGTLVTTAVAGDDGEYATRVPSGQYRVRFFEGPDESWGATWLGGGQTFAGSDILDTSVSTEADGSLVPGSTITGVAADAVSHLSIDYLNVTVFRLLPDGTWYQATGGDASTDGTGHYTITGLSTGTYILQFSEFPNSYMTYQTSYDGRSTTMAGAQKIVISSIGQVVTAPMAAVLRVGSSSFPALTPLVRGPVRPPTTVHVAPHSFLLG
ncbi:MAG TPA: carboxypeptidase regulatory-like domain-containing protein [Mycobacterium sp.]|nr:carboxypeptidase regulatory-like domain-containing protein [Mycobacterium sp.]